jgi:hypothetical protein
LARVAIAVLAGLLAVAGAACSDDDADDGADAGFVADIRRAVDAVEAEMGAGQDFFEVTATPQLTNVFVAIEDATAAVPYLFVDGELQPPAPTLTGASGFTFTADAIDFDEDSILDAVVRELPDASIEALSVEGGDGGTVRYVVSVRSEVGGLLDVTVGADGAVIGVDPL